jgi:DNA repair protein RadC
MQSDRIKNWQADERPREKLLALGAESLSPAELVAVVLCVGQGSFQKGVPGQNAAAFARQLLNRFGGIEGLDRAHVEELSAVHGLGPAKVAQIKAAIELGKRPSAGRLTPKTFLSSGDVARYFRPLFAGKRQEKVIAVLLDGQNVPLA